MPTGRRPWNPFRSEAEAYQFLVVVVAYFAAIVLASVLGGRWAGLAVFITLTAAGTAWVLVRDRAPAPTQQAPVRRDDGSTRILVVANETVAGARLREEIRRAATDDAAEVLVVCPALNSPLRHWASDEDTARARAQERLDTSLARLREAGIEARGEVGDSDPLQAIEDALRTFGADEIVISTHPEGRSNWLERGVVSGARQRFAVPITHVVVDLQAEQVAAGP
jgi:nucleotide-binding universal stress UspA family protein